jgi:hypothetical protein
MTTTEEFFKNEDAAATRGNGSTRPRPNDRARFQFTPFREIVVGTLPSYTVAGLIPRLGVVVIWGKPKPAKPEPNRRPKTRFFLGRAGNFG